MKHCPRCNSEYEDDASRCVDCEAELVEGPADDPIEEVHPESDLEGVYATGNPAIIPLIKSLLTDAGIEFMVKGESIQDVIGWGRLGGFNNIAGPVEFFVASEDALTAREILQHLDDEVPGEAPDEP